jgi:hypothetical protein
MKEQVFSRRIMLRAILAAGYGLWIPFTLSADYGKKETGAANPPTTPTKVPQASVQYQATPKGEQKCANCMHFMKETNTCKLVDGSVSPEGWCILWAKLA